MALILTPEHVRIPQLVGLDLDRAELLLERELARRRAINWVPRTYQQPLWDALHSGVKRAVAVWHRRAGKDDICLRWANKAAQDRVGTYWHMLPEAAQARKAIWEAVNPHTGKRRIDEAFPPEQRSHTRESDMFIRWPNGSTWQVLGSDNYDSLVGSPPIGVTFSEYALADPQAWAMLRPILAENDGWALFISTPRGRNHLFKLFEYAMSSPDWFAQHLTVDQTQAIAPAIIERERREIVAERGQEEANAIIEQEYQCSWDAALPGTYYAAAIRRLEQAGRINETYQWVPSLPVGTAWDLGVGDKTAIWFFQTVGGAVRIIDYLQHNGVGAEWYAKQLHARPYTYYDHIGPHDSRVQDWGSGETRLSTLARHGILMRRLDRAPPEDGIAMVHALLPQCQFNTAPLPAPMEDGSLETPEQAADRMQLGLDALRSYRRDWDEGTKRFKDKPLHDWASDASDSFRYLATGYVPPRGVWTKAAGGNGKIMRQKPRRPAEIDWRG